MKLTPGTRQNQRERRPAARTIVEIRLLDCERVPTAEAAPSDGAGRATIRVPVEKFGQFLPEAAALIRLRRSEPWTRLDEGEHVFDSEAMGIVGRWWNGSFGRLTRRDIWLRTDGRTWRVEARGGDGDSPVWRRDHPDEASARAEIAAMMSRTGGPEAWRDLT